MYGHPRDPTQHRGGARILEKRLRGFLSREPLHRSLVAYGELGRRRGQRVLLHGSLLREVALGGNPHPRDPLDLAVTGDALGYAMALADAGGGRWWPSTQGRETALVSQGGRTLAISLLRQGTLPFLASRDFTVDGLGYDLSEPGEILDAWGGLEDAEKRRLVPSGENSPQSDPARLLRGLALELSWELDPSPRLSAAYSRLADPEFMGKLRSILFWECFDPFLRPYRASQFGDGRLGGALDGLLKSRGLPILESSGSQDEALLTSLDRIEAGLADSQVHEQGQRPGAGLSSAARLAGLLWLRSNGELPPRPLLRAGLDRGPSMANTLEGVWRGARDLLDLGFPYRSTPPYLSPDPIQAASSLLAAGVAAVEPRPEDCTRPACEPVRAIRALLGIRVPQAA